MSQTKAATAGGSQSQLSALSKQSDISIVSQLLEEYNRKSRDEIEFKENNFNNPISKLYEELASLTEEGKFIVSLILSIFVMHTLL